MAMIQGQPIEFSIPESLNLGSYFLDSNLQSGRSEKIALYCEDRTYSFHELWLLTNRMGNVLRTLGVEAGNRVLLVLEDSAEWAAAWLAILKVGGVGTHAYTYLKAHDYEYLLNLVRPKVVIADAVTLENMREATTRSRYPRTMLVAGNALPALRAGECSLTAMLEVASEELAVEPTHRDDIAFWNFSGGTTGQPKAVPHMHRDGLICSEAWNHAFSYRHDDVVLKVPKLFFHYARDIALLSPLRAGASVVLFRERTTAPLLFRLMDKHRPSILVNVPTMMRTMIQMPETERSDLSCLRCCISSGEMLSASLHEEWLQTFGIEVINRYGSAETGMGMLDNRPGVARPGSSGTVTRSVSIRLVDPEGRDVPQGQAGTLLAQCPSAGRYYEREHEKSAKVFLGNGWVNTWDVFKQDEDGYFWHLGRADDMVKVSGVWVSPLEVEHVLQTSPHVKECAVLGIMDADELVKLAAFVVPLHHSQDVTALQEELKRFCRERMAPHKIPRTMQFLDALPKTGSDKVDRRSLRDCALQAIAASRG